MYKGNNYYSFTIQDCLVLSKFINGFWEIRTKKLIVFKKSLLYFLYLQQISVYYE